MVRNVHERSLAATPESVGRLIDTLGGPADALWPADRWPAMRFDRPLSAGARGGHGPIRYHVEDYRPGVAIRFRFDAPRGFRGFHQFEIIPVSATSCLLRHTVVARTVGTARLSWPLVFRPLHDALLEDSLHKAAISLGLNVADPPRWSPWVRVLRRFARRRRSGGRSLINRLGHRAEGRTGKSSSEPGTATSTPDGEVHEA